MHLGSSSLTPLCGPGRPREVTLSPAEADSLASRMLTANRAQNAISASMTARVWAQENGRQDLYDLILSHASKHTLPACVLEVAHRVRPLVAMHRDRRLIRQTGGTRGFLRLNADGARLRAGERFSFDDATPNFGVCIPWPKGGDKMSDRFGVRLGRFQLLVAHCDGTSYIPAFIHQVRPTGSYRGEDAVTLPLRLCRDVALPVEMVMEGGVWQGARMTAALESLGVRLIDAKGRPNQKLVENFFNRLWTRLSLALPHADVGRMRGEQLETSKRYIDCRSGGRDPRRVFPMLSEVLDVLDGCIQWCNNDRLESEEYGQWVPSERWAADLAETPRPLIAEVDLPTWTTAPILRTVTVRRGLVTVSAEDGWGGTTPFAFAAQELVRLERRRVRVAFDNLHPAGGAWIVETDRPRVLCHATCVTAAPGVDFGEAWGKTQQIRNLMRRDYHVLKPGGGLARRESQIHLTSAPTPADTPDALPDDIILPTPSRRGPAQVASRGPGTADASGADHEPRAARGGNLFSGLIRRAHRDTATHTTHA